MTLRPGELEALQGRHPGVSLQERSDGSGLVHLLQLTLPPGWSKTTTDAWFVVPIGYPGAMPDCFWADADLRLANGANPTNSGIQPVGGTGPQPALWFSWHLQAWNPTTDQLVTFANFIEARLRRAA